MNKISIRGALTFSLLLISQASFAGLNLAKVQQCISNEMDMVRVIHPLKAEYLRQEREGSVTELVTMLKEDSDDLDMLTTRELNSSRGQAITKEIAQIKDVLEKSETCADARKAALEFANIYDKKPLLSLSVFFEDDERMEPELNEWNSEAKEALKPAGYTKALASFSAKYQPALALLLVSGETTSVLDEQFTLEADDTMRSALKAIVGDDAPANVLERRLAEKMRKESLQRMSAILSAASDLVSK